MSPYYVTRTGHVIQTETRDHYTARAKVISFQSIPPFIFS